MECNNLTHYHGERLVHEDLSFAVPRGRILGLLGKNGTGKITTISIPNGYLKPCSGERRIFGQEIQTMAPVSYRNTGLLIGGHVQYQFMSITQTEESYAAFYPNQRKKEAYYELMNKLRVATGQRIFRMSRGQHSRVALGLISAQNPGLLVLGDFPPGLDSGYRRLFVNYPHDYARSEGKTIFLTSRIIQDMEQLVDNRIMMGYGRTLIQKPIDGSLKGGHYYACTIPKGYEPPASDDLYHPFVTRNTLETFPLLPSTKAETKLKSMLVPYADLHSEHMNLEDAFIGLAGKY